MTIRSIPLKKVLEDIDFTGLTACYSSKGRTGYNPIMMYAIVTYANMLGIRSVDRIVELCERDLAFIWIAKGQKPKRECFEIMGKDRNSYSKTEIESTFMRMKEDHMLNGQLKPAYNVQVAVENYFIIHTYVSCDRTYYNTLIPVLEKHKKAFGFYPEDTTADSGYCSEKNLLFLKENSINPYIKLQTHENQGLQK